MKIALLLFLLAAPAGAQVVDCPSPCTATEFSSPTYSTYSVVTDLMDQWAAGTIAPADKDGLLLWLMSYFLGHHPLTPVVNP